MRGNHVNQPKKSVDEINLFHHLLYSLLLTVPEGIHEYFIVLDSYWTDSAPKLKGTLEKEQKQ
jgi:hypothetical protein